MLRRTWSAAMPPSLIGQHVQHVLARFAATATMVLAGLFVSLAAASSPALADGSVRVGTQARVTAGLNVRSCPSTRCSIVGGLSAGDRVSIDAGPVSASGYRWWHHSRGGWSIDNNLTYYQAPQPQPGPQPHPQPGPHPQPVQQSAGPSGYTRCAGENQRCSFSGTADVVYGAEGHFTSPRQFNGGVDCKNGIFGDPLYGTVKACYYRPASQPQPQSAQPSTYKLPVQSSMSIVVSQGNFEGDHDPSNGSQHAFDFANHGQSFTVTAARGGRVLGVQSDSNVQCRGLHTDINGHALPDCWTKANFILIDHGDGTSGLYMHLAPGGVFVTAGQYVDQRQAIGTAGTTGWSTGIHLHLQVETTPCATCRQGAWWWTRSVPIAFGDRDVVAHYPNGVPRGNMNLTLRAD